MSPPQKPSNSSKRKPPKLPTGNHPYENTFNNPETQTSHARKTAQEPQRAHTNKVSSNPPHSSPKWQRQKSNNGWPGGKPSKNTRRNRKSKK
jgi:hypothetical protein